MPYCSQCLAEKQAWVGLAFTVFHKKNLSNKKRPLGLSLELKPEKYFFLVKLRTKTLQSRLRTQIKTNIDKDSAYSAPQVRLKMNDKKPSKFQFYFSGVLEAFSMLKK